MKKREKFTQHAQYKFCLGGKKMQRTNYCANALDDIKKQISYLEEAKQSPIMLRSLKTIETLMDQSVKFRLPDNGKLFDYKGKGVGEILMQEKTIVRLPYPVTAIEYDHVETADGISYHENDTKYDAVILLCFECELEGEVVVFCLVLCRGVLGASSKDKAWVLVNFGFSINSESYETRIIPTTELGHELGAMSKEAKNDIGGEATSLTQFIRMLGCSNTHIANDIDPDIKLNISRQKKGKTPFYQYKVLTIGGNTLLGASNSGSKHNSPRMHLRRGHIRRLADKNVWVNSAVIGNKKNGILEKEYKVKYNG